MPNRDENGKKEKNRCLYYLLFCLRASFKSDLRIIMFARVPQSVPYTHRKQQQQQQKRFLFICVVFDNDEQCCLWISCTWICVTKLYARIYRICALVARSFILRCTVGIAEYVWHTLIVTVTVRAHKNQIELLLFFLFRLFLLYIFFLLKEINTRLALRLRIEILSLCQCAYSIGIFTDASKGWMRYSRKPFMSIDGIVNDYGLVEWATV